MCGRYTLTQHGEALLEHFDLFELPPLVARFNIAPRQRAPIVRRQKEGSGRELVLAQFGLLPPWSKDPSTAYKMINARKETVSEKPAYRTAFAKRRCLVPADGFYEWQRLDKKTKQPFWIHLADRTLFAFAGLWERWADPDGEPVESFAILTGPPNALVAPIHDRMPVIIAPEDYQAWLDPGLPHEALEALLRVPPEAAMVAEPVSTRVNDPKNDDPACIAPPEPPPGQRTLF